MYLSTDNGCASRVTILGTARCFGKRLGGKFVRRPAGRWSTFIFGNHEGEVFVLDRSAEESEVRANETGLKAKSWHRLAAINDALILRTRGATVIGSNRRLRR